MKKYAELHPLTLLLYTVFTAVCGMILHHPAPLIVMLICGVILQIVHSESRLKSIRFDIILLLLCTVINPIFSHNGTTVLFFVNDSAITLESLLYGAFSGMSIVVVLSVFSAFSNVSSTEKLLYLTGGFLPKTGAVLTAAITFIPRFLRDLRTSSDVMKTSGISRNDNIFGKIKSIAVIFANSLTRTLENALITADSMKARGFGANRRRQRKKYFFGIADFVLLLLSTITFGLVIFATITNIFYVKFYPDFETATSFLQLPMLIIIALNGLMPVIFDLMENIVWNFRIHKFTQKI